MGLLDKILGNSSDSQSPTDALIQHILGTNWMGASGGEEDPGMSGTMRADAPPMTDSGSNSGSMNEVFGMPPDIAAKVTGNPTLYPNLAAVLGQKQTKVTPRKPLDYLIAAASPLISGLAQMAMSHRRSDRKMNFFSGLAGGGLSSLVNEAGRTDRMKAADRQRQIEDILLQKTVRGTPISGIDPGTGQPKYVYPGTGETVPNIGPQPRAAQKPETREVTDAQGNKTQQEYDPAKGVWKTSQMEAPGDTPGQTKRVPFMSPKQAKEPKVAFEWGTAKSDSKRSQDSEQLFRVEEGKEPTPFNMWRPRSDRLARVEDTRRADEQQVNQWAIKALADSHQRLGPGKKPEEYVNDAVETFRQASGTSKDLASKSSKVSTAIRNVGRNVKSGDELLQLIQAAMGEKAPAAATQ